MSRDKISYRFIALPRVANHLGGLQLSDVKLYLFLWQSWHLLAGGVQTKELTTATLAEEFGLNVRGVQRSINQLEKAGLVTIRWARRPNFFVELHTDLGDDEEDDTGVVTDDKSVAQGVTGDTHVVSTMGSDEAQTPALIDSDTVGTD